jgi:hypothetical protein
VITVEDLLGGKGIEYPETMGRNVSFSKNVQSRKKGTDQRAEGLF